MADAVAAADFIRLLTGRRRVGSYVLFLVAVVFLVFSWMHWRTMPPNESLHIPFACIGGTLLGTYVFMQIEANASRRFLTWLCSHQAEIESGEASYRGERITPDTERVWFMACVSCGVLSVRFYSRPFSLGARVGFRHRLVMTLLTLVAGGWGIPWGAIFTLQALSTNLGGGRTELVRVLLWEIRQEARIARFDA